MRTSNTTRLTLAIFAAAIVSLLVPTAPAVAGERVNASESTHKPSPDYASDRAIVGIKPAERSEAASMIEDEGGDVVEYSRTGSFFVVETSSDSAEWSEIVEDEDSVRYAEPDWQLSASDIAPTDPSWDRLWGLSQIEAPAAWQQSTGSNDVVVGVIDTGVDYTHEDLATQMWVNPNENPATPDDDDNNGWNNDIHGIDCANDDSDPIDDHGHGTHVAGTIGAAANNGKGVVGTAWNVKIMALKFLEADGTGYTSDAIECLYYAINNGAHVTNNSWGGGSFSKTLQEAIRFAASRDQLFIAAAGNDGLDTTVQPHYPASYDVDNVISVAATNQEDSLAMFSNYGTTSVDLAAPGVAIMSTVPGGYGSMSGTSMATPHVSGAAALLLGADPSLRSDAARLRSAILDNVDKVPSLEGKLSTGGRLNVARAVWPDRPTSIHIQDFASSTEGVSKRYWKATVTVTIANDKQESMAGAKVTLAWSRGASSSCITDVEGACSVSKRFSKRSVRKVTASVTSVEHADLPYEAADNYQADLSVSLARISR
jgi:thermitase